MDELRQIARRVESLISGADGKRAVQDLGFISCARAVHLKHVPFYDPCLILVLSGRKTLFQDRRPIPVETGFLATVPAPSSIDLRNEPDPVSRRYTALLIPFKIEHLERLMRSHNLLYEVKRDGAGVLTFAPDETLYASIRHYLTTVGNPRLLNHRLMEILLLLATKNPALLSYSLHRESWSQRVRAVLATDLAHSWDLAEVRARLATTESTLRRNLKREDASFRALLQELRLSTALMQLMQTSLPVYRIAYDCGYQSVSRFTSNFHKRFGVPPKRFRESASESERTVTGSGNPRQT
ncbi:hypothetical protein SVA_2632 [Sulfurifustis variabilis]|uniref:HTH araC/xylS-type domain-containing protein n=1 Tax=Sulfurifustis variabilis TaxID=1675686 RepID=A0A1B4V6N5_9GAMM|nr:helix-turn-helix transcriptional regulator [Sulfurifustis variabilis]BAU49180.1 hypothetical protein SVA_2632 [Sulfurifustis variabilis]